MTDAPEIYYREVNARWTDDVLAISCVKYNVVRRTPKGAWIEPCWVTDYNFDDLDRRKIHWKFILDGVGKRFAYPTRELARESFIIRKKKEIMHCKNQHDRAVRYLALAETGKFGTETEALHEIHTNHLFIFENS